MSETQAGNDWRAGYAAGRAELDKALEAMGVTLAAHFIPQSMSRNAKEARPTLNWRVLVARKDRGAHATDYMQGIGHAPGYPRGLVRRLGGMGRNERQAAEQGTAPRGDWNNPSGMTRRIPPPALADVLACLLQDGEGTEWESFESWADNYGYDTDSRKAEEVYRACQEAGRALAGMFSPAERERLRELAEAAGL